MSVLRGAVIGLGSQGRKHVLAVMNQSDATLVGVADTDVNAGPRMSSELGIDGIPAFDDVRHLVAAVRPDFVIVAVPPTQAMSAVRELCSRQVPCLMEKPLALDLDQARAIVGLPGFGDFVMVAAQRRFSSLDRLVADKLGSRPPSFFTYTYTLGLGGIRSSWRREDARGCLIDMGYHVIDRLYRWFGPQVTIRSSLTRSAIGAPEYTAELRLRYASGLRGWAVLTPISEQKEERFMIRLPDEVIRGSADQVSIRSGSSELHFVEEQPDLLAAQLSFFLERVRLGHGFGDLIAGHLSIMELTEQCYPSPWAESIIKSL